MEILEVRLKEDHRRVCVLELLLERVEKHGTKLELWLYLNLPANRKAAASMLEKYKRESHWRTPSEEETSFDVEQQGPLVFTIPYWGTCTIWGYAVMACPRGQNKPYLEERIIFPLGLRCGSYEKAHQYIADFDEEAAAGLADTLAETLAREQVA